MIDVMNFEIMRAQFIYEKFTQDTDPVHDMNIGIDHLVSEFKKDLIGEDPFLEEEKLFKYHSNKKIIEIDCWPFSRYGYNELLKILYKVIKKYSDVLEIIYVPEYKNFLYKISKKYKDYTNDQVIKIKVK